MLKRLLLKNKLLFKKFTKSNLQNKLKSNNLKFKFTKSYVIENLYNFFNPNIMKFKNTILILKEDYVRCRADLENFKKRSNEELSKAYKYAIEDFSENLLFVLDSLESALIDRSNNIEKLLEGVRLTLKLLINTLEKNKISSILPKKGEVFDPHKHLAISTLKFSDVEDNVIISVLQKGYIIFERVLRPALVVVNKVN